MREKRKRRELAALGHPPFKPTKEQREMVQVYQWNGVPHERIALLLGISYDELVYHFAAELELGEDQLLGFAASRIFYLAGQNADLGVSLRAAQHIAQAKSRRWRIPKEMPDDGSSSGPKRIKDMSLQEVEDELAQMDQRRRASSPAPDEEGEDPSGS